MRPPVPWMTAARALSASREHDSTAMAPPAYPRTIPVVSSTPSGPRWDQAVTSSGRPRTRWASETG